MLCCEICSGFRVTKIVLIFITLVTCNNYLCEFLMVRWLRFTGMVDKVIIAYVKFFQDCIYYRLLKSVQFLTELLKNKNVIAYFETQCIAMS